MSAYLDQDQVVKFYYGNAMIDLEAFLPSEDPVVVLEAQRLVNADGQPEPSQTTNHFTPPPQLHALEDSLSEIEGAMKDLMATRQELAFLMTDLSRLLGSKK
ncbi:hypothetical protein GW916_15320 [bacterium]|nr:hypothetical protein [bacterium]